MMENNHFPGGIVSYLTANKRHDKGFGWYVEQYNKNNAINYSALY